ncbi:RHS repeat-associated core domain-containing protein [Streptomyces venezuelae]|uniref:RHS repeat-associated core domain-containing protein n=1 Tax=Streptomyces venezuelae TaxID=54571 RepID=UPI001CD00AD0|nr:RHS repeat-associated core domain-containing protein [Streptomyces venezuelae]
MLLGGVLPTVAVAAEGGPSLPEVRQPKAVPVTEMRAGGEKRPDAAARRYTPKAAWPAAGTGSVSLARGGRAGDLPVRLEAVVPRATARAVGADTTTARSAGGDVRVTLGDRTAARKAGVDGIVLSVARTGHTAATADPARIEVDYNAFRGAYGGDWAARLRLVELPACALTTPEKPGCGTRKPLKTENDPRTGSLSAVVSLGAAPMLLAATAGDEGPTGTFKATSLQPSGSWSAGGSTGAFTWTYPIEVPGVPGGTAPSISLDYNSQSVDGRTGATNSQASWIGDGWNWEPGFIERKYTSCEDDKTGGTNTTKVGDLCWFNDNATMSLGGRTTELVYEKDKGWHAQGDAGEAVEKLTGAANGDEGTDGVDGKGEHWKVTGTDGTQYFFGRNRLPGWTDGGTITPDDDSPVTNSTWTVPVFGNQAGEPCHAAAFADASCKQAWRWQLDYVVDPRGNAMAYYWKTEGNNYGRNVSETTGKATVTPYIRGGWLDRIDYGLRDDAVYTGKPMGRVQFGVDERCTTGCGTFDETNAKNWPDVPYDLYCKDGATECKDQYSPSFWSRKRLTSITTKLLTGGAYKDVDTWTLDQNFPPSGDGISTPMWLKSIQHTGKAGGTLGLPAVTFTGEQKANRVDRTGDGLAPYIRLRMSQINTETGGTIGVYYSPQDCAPTSLPQPDATNTTRCYPVKWAWEGDTAQLDWFNSYVVTQVVEGDNLVESPDQVTSYSYLGGAAYAKSEDEFTKAEDRVHSVPRGYERVQTRTGAADDPRTLTETRYFRGRDGQAVKDSFNDSVTDRPEFAGMVRQSLTYNGDDTSKLVSSTSYTPWRSAAVATRLRPGLPALVSYKTGVEKETTRTTVTGGTRTTERTSDFDAYGMVSTESYTGDVDVTGDEQCTTTSYARNTAKHILDAVSRVESVSVLCGGTVSRPGDIIDDVRNYYDHGAFGTVPGSGLLTRTEKINGKGDGYEVQSSIPKDCGTNKDQSCADVYGRSLSVADPFGHVTTTAFTPAAGETPTSMVATNPLGHTTTTVYDPLRSQPTQVTDANNKVTTTAYDPLGRVTKVWQPTRSAVTYPDSPSYAFDYLVRKDGPIVTTTKVLAHDSTYREAYAFQDGLLRERQTQEPSPDGAGRLVTEKFYDTRGQVWRDSGRFFATGAAEPALVTGQDLNYPSSTDTEYDGAGRVTAVISKRFGDETKRTTTLHNGDSTTVIPPQGGTATTKVVDGIGRPTALVSYTTADRTASQTTRYTYDKQGRLSGVTDAAGATWTFKYDVRGRETEVKDPDKGTSTFAYDAANRVTDVTDVGRGTTLHTDFDALGRKTAVTKGTTKLAEWTYDTATNGKGHPAKSIRWVNGQAYESATTAYNPLYQPVLQQVTVPSVTGQTALAGTYKWTNSYNANTGQVMYVMQPAAGGLPAEKVANSYTAGAGLLNTVGAGSDQIISANTYDHYGRNVKQEYGAFGQHLWVSKQYDEHTGQVTRSYLDREVAPQRVEDVRYAYDPAGNITSIASAFGQDAGRTTDTQCFRTDALSRITEAWTNTGETCAAAPSATVVGGQDAYWTSYTYDAVGNRKTETDHKTASGPTADTLRTYAAPAAGKHNLPKVTQTGTDPHEEVFTYDASGNTETRKVGAAAQQTLVWNDEGRLASVVQGTKTSSYVYDTEGNRLLRTDSTGTTLYLPGGNELKLDKTTGTVTGTRYYSVGGQAVALRTGGKLTFLFNDHHGTGSTQVTADAVQTVVRRKTGLFGETRGAQPATWRGDKGFVGGTKDADTGLTHLGAREYDPAIGRFVSVDPVMDVADPQQTHGYTYSNNNPVSLSDPSGLKPDDCLFVDCKLTSGGWEVSDKPKGHGNSPAPKTTTYQNQDSDYRAATTNKQRAKEQRKKRLDQIMDDHKFEIGKYIEAVDDANKLACRMTPGPERAGCNFNRYANLYGVKLFGLEYKGLKGLVEEALERIDESAISKKGKEDAEEGDDPSEFGFLNKEFEIALVLAMEGKTVVARSADEGAPGSVNGRKSFDAWVDGVRTEFKTIGPGTSAKHIGRWIGKAANQGADAVIIHLPEGSKEHAEAAVRSAKHAAFTSKTPLTATTVRFIGDGWGFTESLE